MKGITLRITLLGWFVTLLTLAVFVTVIVPQQEAEFKRNLESKALGVAASIKAVAAGAAVSEDYSMIVDQAMQVLAGDQAIDFIVITKNDGFSVVTDRTQWKTESLSGQWRPQARVPSSAIGVVPLFGRRVFQYATPFDYSGIEWGWVHVGLSLEAYDISVRRSYQRTGALAFACVVLSLGVSLAFAKRLVKPIHELHHAVEKVASGDLTARAAVRSGDEVERLAGAFNVMAGTILARNRVLEAVSFTAQELMSAPDWRQALGPVLESVGKASSASRAYVIEAGTGEGGRRFQMCREWTQPHVEPAGMFWQGLDSGGGEFAESLRRQRAVTLQPAQSSPPGKLHQSIQSMLAIPIHTGEQWWGFLGLDDCEASREWGAADKDSLRAVANMLGSTIMRQCAESDLIEAKANLERRVAERTQELQEQVEAKDRAHAELAEAQQRMLQISRQAGMAEVATGVLHNVGNVLNSVNVTTTFVLEKLQQSRVDKLASVTGLLTANANRLGEFLAADPKGAQVLPYLEKLSAHLVKERDGMVSELGSLSRHVGHIKEIVSAQQGYASTSGFVEKVQVSKLLEDALALAQDGLARDDIKVTREFGELPEVLTDKHKVLQIVLNLVRNARDATREAARPDGEIRVRLERAGDGRFRIAVADNGIGLRAEDLNRIFQHGFTTKKGGHGFGLHSGAIAARDLGGSLTASSEGPGRGAVFTLDLPLVAKGSREGQQA